MDGLQPYHAPDRSPARIPPGATHPPLTIHPAPVAHVAAPGPAAKGPSDYLRAVRRRVWLILALAIPIGSIGTVYVLRMPAIYATQAILQVEPPKINATVAKIVDPSGPTQSEPDADERFAPNVLPLLNSRALMKEVVADRWLNLPRAALDGDLAGELAAKVSFRQVPQSRYYKVGLEGRDPEQIKRTLDVILAKFKDVVDHSSRDGIENAIETAGATIKTYAEELKGLEIKLAAQVVKSRSMAPGGRNLKVDEYETLKQRHFARQTEAASIQNQMALAAAAPRPAAAGDAAIGQALAEIASERKVAQKRLDKAKRVTRDRLDPGIVRASGELADLDAQAAELKKTRADGAERAAAATSPAEAAQRMILESINDDLAAIEGQLQTLLVGMKDDMPDYQEYTSLLARRDSKAGQLAALIMKQDVFKILAKTQKSPVTISEDPTEPVVPVRPNRAMMIAGSIAFGLALGLGLVCFLEYIDHSVKVPEHLTSGLALPLLGVVPRMGRNALNHRGGHLWTPGVPDSIEADAYRNLRASLLGATRRTGPLVTLLVTSAKAGEGKSTTALNLAATCARAGERTLLMDVDLRRPSLVDVFTGHNDGVGLVDVLKGDLPWQRAVVQTDLPNLDFLPTGHTAGVPIEVLGSLELRQLLLSLSQDHYDRVILDGPAVLGLADCRMLGRIVDAAVMVVRSGSQEIRSLQRAKTMLEQSDVTLAGLIFNGIADDLENWSSYGPGPSPELFGNAARRPNQRSLTAAGAEA